MKSIFKSKTFWFNIVTGVVTVAGIIPVTPVTAAVVAVGNVILRFITNQPVNITGPMIPSTTSNLPKG